MSIANVQRVLTNLSFNEANWDRLAYKLLLDYETVSNIRSKHKDDHRKCLDDVIVRWLESTTTDLWYSELTEALRQSGYSTEGMCTYVI